MKAQLALLTSVNLMTPFWMNVTSFMTSLVFICLLSLKDGFRGFSPGKWLMDLRVLDETTRQPAGFLASFKRNIPLFIPIINLIVMLNFVGTFGRGRRLGDGWARTIVVWREHENKPPFNPVGYVCFTCGYDLRGNVSGICPECGTPIPQKRRTEAEPAPVHST